MIPNVLRNIFLQKKVVDNFIFYLCYRWTVLMLVVFSFIVTCRLVIGYSFDCFNSSTDNGLISYIKAHCYASGVYSLPVQDMLVSDPLVTKSPYYDYQRYQSFYSWVNLFFLLHAFNFYLPHLLWKSYELGYTRNLITGLENAFAKEEKRKLELCYLAKYILTTQGKHKIYTSLYIFFEACNCAISLAQTLWLIAFFDVAGVPDYIPISLETWSDFQKFYFPLSSRCSFIKIGAANLPQRHTPLCVLPLNSLYMKLFLFLRAWYIFLTILCGLVLIYRIALLVPFLKVKAIRFSAPLAKKETLKLLCYRLSYSDSFFLTRLQKIMTDVDFAQVLEKISIASQYRDEKYDNNSSFVEEVHKERDSSTTTSQM